MRKNEKNEKIEAIKALDEQIILVRGMLKTIAEDPNKGVGSNEYSTASVNLETLTEAREHLANSEAELVDKSKVSPKIDWNVVITAIAAVTQIGLMAWFEQGSPLPRCASKLIDFSRFTFPKMK